MTSNLNHQVEDQMLLISQLYPGMYTQMVPKEGEGRRRRIRKKSKAEESGSRIVKRKLSTEQVNMLEMNFGNEHKLECERKDRLALELGLDPRQVAVWFQNRRARWKSKKLEEEYSKLKSVHESVVVEKCHLETEVIKLKEQLSEADREIQRLSERWDGNGSPSSCANPHFPQEFEMQGFENLCYIPDQTNYIHGMEWLNLYAL